MAVRVLIVDDSGFFCRRLTEILDADKHIEVVGKAANGSDAVDKVAQLKPDVVTMDVEMPIMDGITAVRRIMASNPTPILMLSSSTTAGANATLDALDAGAMDFLPKTLEDISKDLDIVKRTLCARIRILGAKGLNHKTSDLETAPRPSMMAVYSAPPRKISTVKRSRPYRLLAIGTSTGGPIALQKILTLLPQNFPLPIVLVQHMPANFTASFAERLNGLCRISVKEAQDGDQLKPGEALLAPGGRQMRVDSRGSDAIVRIGDSEEKQNYRPCVDITFSSISKLFADDVLAIILTGMGADGREGARRLKKLGSTVWAQNEESCVVYGMPMAVVKAGLADQILPLSEIAQQLIREI
ncbi:MAG: chemotaxis response regulator protein-glutamate methylesterase [Gammaproteobacteria bacterium]|nr:chemotaxis response regulator protein-glutamate methylesterase [Gammaproteobacteria bacterium]